MVGKDLNIGFVFTRLAGTDSVSLEMAKWVTVLRRADHEIYGCAGELEVGGIPGNSLPGLHFLDSWSKVLEHHGLIGGTDDSR